MTVTLPLIVSDLDGVLVNTADQALKIVCQTFKVPLRLEDWTEYSMAGSFFDRLRLQSSKAAARFSSRKDFSNWIHSFVWGSPFLYDEAVPYWSWWQALLHHVQAGGRLILCTGRPVSASIIQSTEQWLARWLLPPVPLPAMPQDMISELSRSSGKIFLCWSCEYEGGKPELLKMLTAALAGGEIWAAEDRDEDILAFREVTGARVLVPDRPWTHRFRFGHDRESRLEIWAEELEDRIQHLEATSRATEPGRTKCESCDGTGFVHGSCCRACEGSMSVPAKRRSPE